MDLVGVILQVQNALTVVAAVALELESKSL